MIQEIVLATRNPDKGRELAALLADLGIIIRTLVDFPEAPEVVEDGETCRENAVKKAREISRHTGLIALADDTGLEVEALEGWPGVYAARYAGENATYEDNYLKLLQEMKDVPKEKRGARFLTVAVVAKPSGDYVSVDGILEGVIAEQPMGDQGFGYDPVFLLPEQEKNVSAIVGRRKKHHQPSRPCIYESEKNPQGLGQQYSKRRGVAQPGSAPALGAGCRRFKSSRPDHSYNNLLERFEAGERRPNREEEANVRPAANRPVGGQAQPGPENLILSPRPYLTCATDRAYDLHDRRSPLVYS